MGLVKLVKDFLRAKVLEKHLLTGALVSVLDFYFAIRLLDRAFNRILNHASLVLLEMVPSPPVEFAGNFS